MRTRLLAFLALILTLSASSAYGARFLVTGEFSASDFDKPVVPDPIPTTTFEFIWSIADPTAPPFRDMGSVDLFSGLAIGSTVYTADNVNFDANSLSGVLLDIFIGSGAPRTINEAPDDFTAAFRFLGSGLPQPGGKVEVPLVGFVVSLDTIPIQDSQAQTVSGAATIEALPIPLPLPALLLVSGVGGLALLRAGRKAT